MHEEKYQLNMMPQSSDHTLAVYAQEGKASHRNCNFQTRCYGNFKYDNIIICVIIFVIICNLEYNRA